MSDSGAMLLDRLPLAAFERYMLADDRPEYPMTFVLGLRLLGWVDRAAMDRAVADAAARHPMLRATVADAESRRPAWAFRDPASVPVDWGDPSKPLTCPGGEAIDLRTQPGSRMWIRHDESSAVLTAQFHHAATDAVGGLQFLGDVLAAYDARTPSRPLDSRLLSNRGVLGRSDRSLGVRLRVPGQMLVETFRFARHRPRPLAVPTDDAILPAVEPATGFFGIQTRTLERAFSQQVVQFGRSRGATVNDLLLCAAFGAIDDWNRRHDPAPRRGWLRLSMPINLRGPDDRLLPAANAVTMSFLTRNARRCAEPALLLPGMVAETSQIKRSRRGLNFIRNLELTQAMLGRIPGMLIGPRCFATMVLSNLGRVEPWLAATPSLLDSSGRVASGGLVVEEVFGVPPLRPGTHATMMAFGHAGRISLSLRTDPHCFTPSHARELLDGLVSQLARLVG